MKFKEGTSAKEINQIEPQFGELEQKISTIIDYEWGLATTDESDRNQGFTHSFLVTFKNQAGLEASIPHEAHQAFVKVFKPKIEKILISDYIAK